MFSLLIDSAASWTSAAAITGTMVALSMVLDISAVVRMFIPWKSDENPAKPAVKWEIFRAFNWITSWAFLISLVHLLSIRSRGLTLFHAKFAFVICLMSLAYLFLFFGVSLIYTDMTEESGMASPQAAQVSPSTNATVPSSPASTPRTSLVKSARSPIALGICAVAIVVPVVFAFVFLYHAVPILLSLASATVWPLISSAMTPEAVPWTLVSLLVTAMFLRERASRKALANASKMLIQDDLDKQRLKSYPDKYPNGWYRLMNANDLKPGDVKHVQALGQQFAVYRGRNDQKVYVLDAYCPHLGANLAVGGRVLGDCLECPFHQWQFNGNGSVAKIPYSDAPVPTKQKAHSWPSTEYYGFVLVYYDCERRDAPYSPPALPCIDSGDMTHRGRHQARDVRMHVQEFAENSVDFAHFQPLHGSMMVPWTSYTLPLLKVQHRADWVPGNDSEGKHIAHFKDHAILKLFGREIQKTDAFADITFVGPAGVVYFHFHIPDLGNILMFQCHTPATPMLLETHFSWFADKSIPNFLVSYVVGSWVSQWANDLLMWENKVFLPKPLLVKGDGPVPKLRRWYSQFYGSGEPKVAISAPGAGAGTESDASIAAVAVAKPVARDGADCIAHGASDW